MLSSAEELLKTLPMSDENLHLLTELCEVIPLQIAVKSLRDDCYGSFVLWNRGAEVGLGITSDEALGLTDASLFPPDQAAFFEDRDREVQRLGEAVVVPRESITSRTSGLRIRRTIKTPIFDAEEQLVAVLQVSEDITDHNGHAPNGVSKGYEPDSLNGLFPGVIYQFRVDAEGRSTFPYISDGIVEMTGDPACDITSGKVNFLDRLVSGDLSGYLVNIAKSRREGKVCRQEFRVQTKTGDVKWLSSVAVPKQHDDGATTWHGFLSDVTLSKQAFDAQSRGEERLRCALEGTGAAAWEVDLVDGSLYLSREWKGLFGFELDPMPRTFDEWLGKIHLDDVEMVNGLRSTGPVMPDGQQEFRHLCGDGKYKRVLLRAHPVRDLQGQLIRLVGTISDAGRRSAGAEKPAGNPVVASRNGSPQQAPVVADGVKVLAKMNHEIRTLLNAVIGFSEILAVAPLETEQRDHVLSIYENSTELLQILSDVLDYSKIEAGRLTPKPVPVNVLAEVQKAVESFQNVAAARSLELDVLSAGEIPKSLLCDTALLNQVLRKLVNNALKFTTSGSVEVEVIPDGEATGQTCPIVIRVRDTGPGIAPERLDTLFEPFAGPDGTGGKAGGGIDLGLALVNQLCALAGWTVEVASELGRGTTFTVRLPLGVSGTATKDAPPKRMGRNLPDQPPKILVVDDNSTNRQLIRLFLRDLGHVVDEAKNGFEAVEMASGTIYDLIFMDLSMPVMDGFEATRRIREASTGGEPMIVALIAHALAEHRERSLEAGMDAYLNKPVNRADLEGILGRV